MNKINHRGVMLDAASFTAGHLDLSLLVAQVEHWIDTQETRFRACQRLLN
jgi:hypothetical protein